MEKARNTELERIWDDHTNREDYLNTRHEGRAFEIEEALQHEVMEGVAGGRSKYDEITDLIGQYGYEKEQKGFISGYKMALRVAAECLNQ